MNMDYVKGQIVGYVPIDIEPIAAPPEPERWYVLKTFANKESKVMRTFKDRGISAYFPTVRNRRVVRGRACDGVSALFAGVIFIPDFQAKLGGVKVDGVEGYFKMGDCYPYLTGKLMEDVRKLEAIGHLPVARKRRLWSVGQLVRVTNGPFALFQGKIEQLDSRGRLKVLVDIFKRMTPIELEEGQIEPA
jgi:transcription termination/antitermination protein NusG